MGEERYERYIDLSIIFLGYLTVLNFFYENLFFILLSITVVFLILYRYNLPKKRLKSDRFKIDKELFFYRSLPGIYVLFFSFGLIIIINLIKSFDIVNALQYTVFWFVIIIGINNLIIKKIPEKFKKRSINPKRSKHFCFEIYFLAIFFSILVLIGNNFLYIVIFLIAFYKSVVIKLKGKKFFRYLFRKIKILERNFLDDWIKVKDSEYQAVITSILFVVLLLIFFNFQFIDFQNINYASDMLFLLVIISMLVLIYLSVKLSWSDWKFYIPFGLIFSYLFVLIINPSILPIYHGVKYNFQNLGHNVIIEYSPIFSDCPRLLVYVFSVGLISLLFSGFIFPKIREGYFINDYKKFSKYEFKLGLSYLYIICLASILFTIISNFLPSEIMYIFPFWYNLMMLFLAIQFLMYYIIYLILIKNLVNMIKYEKLRNYKSQQTVKSFIKRNIKKGNLKRFYTKNQFLILFLVFFLTLLILVIIPFFNISSDQTPATESAYPQLTIDKLVEEYSYGIGNSIAVDNYVRVDFSIFTNDTIEYYLTGENGYLSKIIRLKGPINNISEFSCLKSGKYQLIYYILEDHDEDGEAKIHIDLIRTPLKKFVIAPEVMPLIIFGIFSIFVKPTIYYQL